MIMMRMIGDDCLFTPRRSLSLRYSPEQKGAFDENQYDDEEEDGDNDNNNDDDNDNDNGNDDDNDNDKGNDGDNGKEPEESPTWIASDSSEMESSGSFCLVENLLSFLYFLISFLLDLKETDRSFLYFFTWQTVHTPDKPSPSSIS